jgi:hypothetical protein
MKSSELSYPLAALVLVVVLGCVGCTPPHYSVAVTRGPTHVTYAQRHHEIAHPDYLVDCALAADGTPTDNCAIVPLEAK